MPLPLAHPAAVLPLRRFCPKYLSFSALMIGSLVPDVAYALNRHGSFSRIVSALFGQRGRDFFGEFGIHSWDGLSHSLLGSVIFCIPFGLLLHAGFRSVRGALVSTLPNPHREVLAPLCQGGRHSLLTYAGSLLISVWLHLLWDSLAKDDWWLAKLWPVLQVQVAQAGSSRIELYQAIWLVSTVGGTAALVFAYRAFLKRQQRSLGSFDRREAPYYLLWFLGLFFSGLIGMGVSLHYFGWGFSPRSLFHFFHAFFAIFATVFGCFVLGVAVIAIVRAEWGRVNAKWRMRS